MPIRDCCVDSCKCNARNCKLTVFPQNKNLRKIWLDVVTPHSQRLNNNIYVNSKICLHHFEGKYVEGEKRKVISCPTLFTEKEILEKKPLTPLNLSLCNDDTSSLTHQISLKRPYAVTEQIVSTPTTLDITNPGSSIAQAEETRLFVIADAVSKAPVENQLPKITHNPVHAEEMTTGLNNAVSKGPVKNLLPIVTQNPVNAVEITSGLMSDGVTHPNDNIIGSTNSGTCLSARKNKRNRIVKSVNKLTPRCKKIYIKYTNLLKSKRRLIYNQEEKMDKIRDLCQRNSFESLIEDMTPAARTFLLMQVNQHKKKVQRRRFNTEEKVFALSLSKHSPKGYKFLQKMFVLPSRTTLGKFARNFSIDCGLNTQLLQAFKEITKDWDMAKKMCSIVFDEVALTPNLTFVESQDHIEGFVNFGHTKELKFCDHALVIMIRGICSSWTQPIAYYLCEGSTPAITMKNILRDVVDAVSGIGLVPKALICDQGATFRSCMNSFQNDFREHQLRNNIEPDSSLNINGHKLHLIYDPPHLIKGIRNNFLDKDMIFRGQVAKWSDIIHVYKEDCFLGDIRFMHKLTDEHVFPEKVKKMKVKNATQVLSERTAAALRFALRFGGNVTPTMKTTSDAVLFFDRLFDSVNGSRSGSAAGKLRGPVKEVDGISQHVLLWQEAIKTLDSLAFVDSKSKRALQSGHSITRRIPSVGNWITTLKSFIRLWSDLKEAGVKSFYTRNLNQDPLENFFGRIRALNYRNTNPDCYTFRTAYKSLVLSKVLTSHSVNFNCEDDNTWSVIGSMLFENNDAGVFPLVADVGERQQSAQTAADDGAGPSTAGAPAAALCTAAAPAAAAAAAPSLQQQARQEKRRTQAAAFTAGYVSRKLLKRLKCETCKAVFLTTDYSDIHSWITVRERSAQGVRYLNYPNERFVRLFNDLICVINDYLSEFPHDGFITRNIREIFLRKCIVGWFGCVQHHAEALNYFINLVNRLQIHNWCNCINKILKGTDIARLSVYRMTAVQRLALKKYKTLRCKK